MKRVVLAVAVLAWVAGLAFGTNRIWSYKSTPGIAAAAPDSWPGSALIEPAAGKPILVMFVHPHCSCTRASLAELDTILRHSGDRLSAWILFLHPPGSAEQWDKTPTWDAAQRLRGVHVVSDHDGVEAERFGAATSGQVVLYGADGHLQFSGGITAARGHVGHNSGEERVVSLVNTGKADAHVHAVFGCELHDPNSPGAAAADEAT